MHRWPHSTCPASHSPAPSSLWPRGWTREGHYLQMLSSLAPSTPPPEFSAAAVDRVDTSYLCKCVSSLPRGFSWHGELGRSNGGDGGGKLTTPGSTLNQLGVGVLGIRLQPPSPLSMAEGPQRDGVVHSPRGNLLLRTRYSMSSFPCLISPLSQQTLRSGLGCSQSG